MSTTVKKKKKKKYSTEVASVYASCMLCRVTSGIGTIQEIGIPSPGAATTIFVLSAVGLPGMQAGVLVVVKWLL